VIERLRELGDESRRRIAAVTNERELEEARIACLGRKSELNQAARGLGKLPESERREVGRFLNELRGELERLLDEAREHIHAGSDVSAEGLDVTLPGRRPWVGRKHPLTRTFERLETIFLGLGFDVAEGPHIEDEFHNFDALNIPAEHPSRDAWDTFYLDGGMLLRTHTSPVQIRTMQSRRPPVRIIAPGKVFRNETPDASHAAEFFQLEGLAVGPNIRFGELKGVLTSFLHQLFGEDRGVRFRAGFFPFTEPSTEVDIECVVCGGQGCPVCKRTGWVELLGAGMVDPRVFRAVGYDPEKVTGYAFGLGVDRICMMLSGMDDIRPLLDNDVRFLRSV
jgi:phenylalanyl-tRNA synthetase alpha chain